MWLVTSLAWPRLGHAAPHLRCAARMLPAGRPSAGPRSLLLSPAAAVWPGCFETAHPQQLTGAANGWHLLWQHACGHTVLECSTDSAETCLECTQDMTSCYNRDTHVPGCGASGLTAPSTYSTAVPGRLFTVSPDVGTVSLQDQARPPCQLSWSQDLPFSSSSFSLASASLSFAAASFSLADSLRPHSLSAAVFSLSCESASSAAAVACCCAASVAACAAASCCSSFCEARQHTKEPLLSKDDGRAVSSRVCKTLCAH